MELLIFVLSTGTEFRWNWARQISNACQKPVGVQQCWAVNQSPDQQDQAFGFCSGITRPARENAGAERDMATRGASIGNAVGIDAEFRGVSAQVAKGSGGTELMGFQCGEKAPVVRG
jgi:hypothetical protein